MIRTAIEAAVLLAFCAAIAAWADALSGVMS